MIPPVIFADTLVHRQPFYGLKIVGTRKRAMTVGMMTIGMAVTVVVTVVASSSSIGMVVAARLRPLRRSILH